MRQVSRVRLNRHHVRLVIHLQDDTLERLAPIVELDLIPLLDLRTLLRSRRLLLVVVVQFEVVVFVLDLDLFLFVVVLDRLRLALLLRSRRLLLLVLGVPGVPLRQHLLQDLVRRLDQDVIETRHPVQELVVQDFLRRHDLDVLGLEELELELRILHQHLDHRTPFQVEEVLELVRDHLVLIPGVSGRLQFRLQLLTEGVVRHVQDPPPLVLLLVIPDDEQLPLFDLEVLEQLRIGVRVAPQSHDQIAHGTRFAERPPRADVGVSPLTVIADTDSGVGVVFAGVVQRPLRHLRVPLPHQVRGETEAVFFLHLHRHERHAFRQRHRLSDVAGGGFRRRFRRVTVIPHHGLLLRHLKPRCE